jgi:hypothetical protein
MIALIRLYYAGPIFIATESWISGDASSAVQAAQAAAVNHGAGTWPVRTVIVWVIPTGSLIRPIGTMRALRRWPRFG